MALGREETSNQHHTHTPQASAAKAKGLVAAPALRPWITQPTLVLGTKRAATTLRTQQRNMEGTMLRYQSRGVDAGAFTEGYTLDALSIDYLAYAFIGSIVGRLPLPRAPPM